MPIVPRPACDPTTGPMSPTTISPRVVRPEHRRRTASTSLQSACEDGEVLDRRRSCSSLLDEERERLGARALLAALLDLAVAHLDDRLDRQRRGEHRLGAADAAALLQVVERVERAPHAWCARRGRWRAAATVVERCARRGEPGAVGDDRCPSPSVQLRLSTTCTGTHVGDAAGGELGALHRGRQRGAERDRRRCRSRRRRRGARYACSNWPGAGAAVSGSVGDAAHRAQNSAGVRSLAVDELLARRCGWSAGRSRCRARRRRDCGRSHAESVTMRTPPPTTEWCSRRRKATGRGVASEACAGVRAAPSPSAVEPSSVALRDVVAHVDDGRASPGGGRSSSARRSACAPAASGAATRRAASAASPPVISWPEPAERAHRRGEDDVGRDLRARRREDPDDHLARAVAAALRFGLDRASGPAARCRTAGRSRGKVSLAPSRRTMHR